MKSPESNIRSIAMALLTSTLPFIHPIRPIFAAEPTETISFDNQLQRTKEFVVMGYEGIQFELRSSHGAYLTTLMDLLNIDPSQQPQRIEQVRELSKRHKNIMDFADSVLMLRNVQLAGQNGKPAYPNIEIPSGADIYSGEKLENALAHLTRAMTVTVYLKNGTNVSGRFIEYNNKRLWIRKSDRQSILLSDILAIQAPQL